ncbi:hypothetical protein, variant [Aphanomyces invadans]|uniref:Cyclic nucleotide-binding domain-containing protein n=1 Tax=Aphanomyces invadans TaxID=157072 RepID=A0A024U0I3_9STRA|nr:hypothetical protein, variant [Aphanomyces invadans]ETV99890.1 hypothetical protein, variant [Aphanomyces invadans]|eukprot:XP_008871666.1 hypothetical protein, variant [Aphanomyces invadans]
MAVWQLPNVLKPFDTFQCRRRFITTMTSKSNGTGPPVVPRRSVGTLAPVTRGHSITKISAKAPGPSVTAVGNVCHMIEKASARPPTTTDVAPDDIRGNPDDVTSSVAETDDVVHPIDDHASQTATTSTKSSSKRRLTATSPRVVDLTQILAAPINHGDEATQGPFMSILQGESDHASTQSSFTPSTSPGVQVNSPMTSMLHKASMATSGSGSLHGSKGRGLLQLVVSKSGLITSPASTSPAAQDTSSASALLVQASSGGSGALRRTSSKLLLQRSPSVTALLTQQKGSSKRLVVAVGKVLQHITQDSTRPSFVGGAAAVARTAAGLTKRLSLLRADTNVNAEELEHELNDMAASQMSLIARRHRAPFYMSIHSRFKRWWDALLAVVTFYAVVVVPMDLSFNLWDSFPWVHAVQALVEFVFILDIVVAFRTSFLISATHEEVTDVALIRRHYLTLWFWVDCLGSIPSSVLGCRFRHSDFAIVRLFVFLRILRLSSSPTFPNAMAWASHKFSSSGVRLATLLAMYLLLHHYIACSYYLLVQFENGADNADGMVTWRVPFAANDTLGVKYLGSYFRGLVVTSGSDLGPSTSLERLWGTTMFTIGIIANACVAGICKSMLTQMNKVQDEQVHRQDSIELCLRNCHATSDLTSKINSFYSTAYSHESAHHASDLFHGMPEKLHFELSVALNQSFLNKVPLFRALEPEGIVAVMECVEETVAMPGDMIIRAGEPGRAFYMIKMGSVEVYDNLGPKGTRVSIKHMHAGEFFGEMSLIRQGTASANVIATSFCVLLVLYKEIFDWITMENEHLKSFMERSQERRSSEATAARRVRKLVLTCPPRSPPCRGRTWRLRRTWQRPHKGRTSGEARFCPSGCRPWLHESDCAAPRGGS